MFTNLILLREVLISRAGLFSSTFLFEHSFGCHLTLLDFRLCSRKNIPIGAQNALNSKIGSKPTKSGERTKKHVIHHYGGCWH